MWIPSGKWDKFVAIGIVCSLLVFILGRDSPTLDESELLQLSWHSELNKYFFKENFLVLNLF